MHTASPALLFISLMLANQVAEADSLSLGFGTDSASGQDRYLQGTMDLNADTALSMYAAQNEQDNSDNQIIKSQTFAINVSEDLDDLGVNLEYEQWGDPDELKIDAWRTRIQWYTATGALSLGPELRFITLNTNLAEVRFNSGGVDLGWDYFITDRLISHLNYTTYWYSADVTRLNTSRVLQTRLSSTTLQLAGGLQDKQVGIGMSYAWQGLEIGANAAQGQSAIDQRLSNIYSAYVAWHLTEAYTVGIQAGHQVTENEPGISLYSVSITRVW